MKTLMVMMILLYGRPPVPAVPYPYDPNMVDGQILRWVEVEPNNCRVLLPIKAFDADGDDAVLSCGNPTLWIPPKTANDPNTGDGVYYQVTDTPDPNAPGAVTHKWVCDIRAGYVEQVRYFNFEVSDIPADPNEPPLADKRCVLVFVRKKKTTNRPPVLDIGPVEFR